MSGSADVSTAVLVPLRRICSGLPEAYEEKAWVGTRWRVRKRTFAHVVRIEAGSPPAFARAVGHDGPLTVLTFRGTSSELDALANVGFPYFRTRWGREVGGMALDKGTDWDEVAELLTESYCVMAPRKLAALVDRPAG